MKLGDLIDAGLLPAGTADLDIRGLALDNRAVKPGDLFAALPGVKTHGWQFAEKAVEAGAVAVLTETGKSGLSVPVIAVDDPALVLAHAAARLYPRQPETIAAVTGTNGKSSTVDFLRQMWTRAGIDGASLGTLGVARGDGRVETGYTTPDAIALHKALDELAGQGVTHLAMEASSHGLKQRRMHGVRVSLTGFTNLTQDHLDYHPDFADYFVSKRLLFTQLAEPGSPAVINVDSEWGEKYVEAARAAKLDVITVGWRGRDWQIREITPRPASQQIVLSVGGKTHRVELPLVGEFQTANAVGAAALAAYSGVDANAAIDAINHLAGVPGRLEEAARTKDGSPVLVDYAHTPDGLDKLLRAARPHTKGRIILVFGCGGDRDPTKRDKMGAIAIQLADEVIVTDDNPRSEDAATIRQAILRGAQGATEIGDRAEAIRAGVAMLKPGDALVLAGKGHETGQKVGDIVHPFDDREEARKAIAEREGGQ